jgi:dTDP-4-dehydrorhamnose reductase
MKILITGGSGRIGFGLLNGLINDHEVIPTFLTNVIDSNLKNAIKLDISKKEDVLNTIRTIKPDIVIHTAALANVDLCETDHNLADSINVDGTKNIAEGCQVTKAKMIYVSTSYVFNGNKPIYVEDDEYFPATYYGYTKYLGEKIVRDSNLPYLILRTDQPFGWIEKWQKDNSVTRVLSKLNESELIKDAVDWYNNPTLIADLVDVAKKLINLDKVGIYHVVGSDFINRFEWAKIVAEIFNKDMNLVKPLKSEDLNLPAKRVKVNLSNEKVLRETGIKMKGVRDGLLYMLNENQQVKN